MELQDKRKPISGFFRSKYVKIFLCYGLGSCGLYFLFMFTHGRPIEADIYLAINLIVSVVLWALIGLAINHWAEKAPNDKVPALKIAFAIVAFVFFYQIASAIIIRHYETVVPIIGDWLTFSVTPNFIYSAEGSIQHSIFTVFTAIPTFPRFITLPLVLLLGIFMYRVCCFGGYVNKRILAVCVSFYMTGILSGYLADVVFWGSLNFLMVRNFVDLGLIYIYHYVAILVALQIIFVEPNGPSSKKPLAELKAYFKYEADSIRAVVSKFKAG